MSEAPVEQMVEQIHFDGVLYAIIIRREFRDPGAHFVTPNDFSQQLAFMSRPTGHTIEPHFHREVRRDVQRTLEVLVLRQGRLRVDFYSETRECLGSRVLQAGDAILLANGGHGFEVLEHCEMYEVKQGPFLGEEDKVRFRPAAAEKAPS